MKSWVVGIKSNGLCKAYDWNDLVKNNFIQDTIGSQPVLVLLEKDTVSFHVYNRIVQGRTLFFIQDSVADLLKDSGSHTVWNKPIIVYQWIAQDFQLDALAASDWHS
jgi:hypothetical protein